MRKIIILCCVALLFSCKSKKVSAGSAPTQKSIVLVKPEDVEPAKQSRAYDLGKRLLESCNTSHFKAFSATEATDKVRQNATKDNISNICKKINQRNGRFLGLTLLDVFHDKVNDEFIFRYSIQYEKKLFKRELSVRVDADNKVSAIATKEIKPKPL
jgi:hypothetical protein